MPERRPKADTERNRLIRRIHAQARAAGVENDERRCLQAELTGIPSCADMTVAQLRMVAGALGGRAASPLPDGPYTTKMQALWRSGWNLGVVRFRSDRALAAFVKRTTGLDSARWATDPIHAGGVIEGLKALLAREAGVDWSPYQVGRRQVHDPRRRVLEAQLRVLRERNVPGADRIDLDDAVPWGAPDSRCLQVIGQWGARIRETRPDD